MHTGLEDRARDTDRLAEYFAERARGGVGLIITGGYAPNRTGWLLPFAAQMRLAAEARRHRRITDAVHDAGGKILLQVLHAGRYAYHPFSVSASSIKAPINPFRPRACRPRRRRAPSTTSCAAPQLAQEAGYDGVEIMGSEGYLLNQFLAPRTNQRTDAWGGTPRTAGGFPVEIVRRTRAAVGADFIICYRMSMADYVEDGQSWDEIVALATEVEAAGATIINTGIGWHEARVPTIVTSVPNGAFVDISDARRRTRQHPGGGVEPDQHARRPPSRSSPTASVQLISMARPLLADPEWVLKAQAGRSRRDQHLHRLQPGLPGPRVRAQDGVVPAQSAGRPRDDTGAGPDAAHADAWPWSGPGPAGLAAAVTRRRARPPGDAVRGQRRRSAANSTWRRRIPGKEEFSETIRYYTRCSTSTASTCGWRTRATADELAGFDEVVLATGVVTADARPSRASTIRWC